MDGRSKLNTTEKEEGSVTVVIQSVLRVVQFMPRSIRILPVSYTSTPFYTVHINNPPALSHSPVPHSVSPSPFNTQVSHSKPSKYPFQSIPHTRIPFNPHLPTPFQRNTTGCSFRLPRLEPTTCSYSWLLLKLGVFTICWSI